MLSMSMPQCFVSLGPCWVAPSRQAPSPHYTRPPIINPSLAFYPGAGAIPTQWPNIFHALESFYLQYNSLSKVVDGQPVPSLLPLSWTTLQVGFPALSILVLYPGNDYLCSIPDREGNLQSVNRGRYRGVWSERVECCAWRLCGRASCVA